MKKELQDFWLYACPGLKVDGNGNRSWGSDIEKLYIGSKWISSGNCC